MVMPEHGKNPVLAHEFINFMIDTKNAVDNFGYIGYQPPQQSLDADNLVADGYVPQEPRDRRWSSPSGSRRATARSSCRRTATAAWQRIWQEFKAGA